MKGREGDGEKWKWEIIKIGCEEWMGEGRQKKNVKNRERERAGMEGEKGRQIKR